MIITNFKEIKESLPARDYLNNYKEVSLGVDGKEYTLRVLQYLPIKDKADLVSYVVNAAIDENTGCFSPVRVNVYYGIGIMMQYCRIKFDDVDVVEAYDIIDSTNILDIVMNAIPEEERVFMESLLNDTIGDISRYNSSLAGMMHSMSGEATNLDESIQAILEKIKNKEGLEVLSEIKNVVGTD